MATKGKSDEHMQREEFNDYLRVRRERERFDPVAWDASIAQRERMPRLSDAALDPGPEIFPERSESAAAFAADGETKATVRSTKANSDSLGFVRAVTLSSREAFTPGTLAITISAKDLDGVDPRTLHLFRWDEATEQYRLVSAFAANLEGGYVWGRVTTPGRYAVFGLPSLATLRDLKKKEVERLLGGRHIGVLLRIVIRLFSPEGPWRSLGPRNLSCCIYDLAVDPSNGDRVYAAASDGGVWRLDSVAAYPRQTWVPLTDGQPSLKIQAVAVSPAEPKLVYYADTSGRLFRSIDRGENWTQAGSANLGSVNRILCHPTDSNRVFVASSTGFWSSPTRGTGWDHSPGQTTMLDGDISDAELDPTDPAIIYAGQRSVGVVKSTNGGGSWRTVLPWSTATAPVDSTIKVAVGGQGTPTTRTVAAKLDQEIFISRNGGEQIGPTESGWQSECRYGGTGQGWWNSVIAVDPNDDDVILAGAQQLYRRDSSGNWSLVVNYYAPHEDQHRVVFDRTQPGVVYLANDGGAFRSTDGGATWQTSGDDVAAGRDLTLGLVTAELYRAGVSGDHAVADAYHQGLLGANSLATGDWGGIEGHSWEFANVYGDPVNHGRYFVFGGTLIRRLFPNPPSGAALLTIGNFQPTAIAVDPAPGSNTLLAGNANGHLMRAPDGNSDTPTWGAMSGFSLSTDRAISIAFAPSSPQRAYALSGQGRVFTCANVDGGSAWSEVQGLPSGGAVAIGVAPENDQLLFAITSAQAYRSIDGGNSWTPIPGTTPHTIPAGSNLVSLAVREGTVYVASASGIYVSPDAGQNWFPDVDGLPNAEIKELIWQEDDLFAVTFGRGLWHSGNYFSIEIPPIEREPSIPWLIELWHLIHGGDPGPESLSGLLGHIGERLQTIAEQRRA